MGTSAKCERPKTLQLGAGDALRRALPGCVRKVIKAGDDVFEDGEVRDKTRDLKRTTDGDGAAMDRDAEHVFALKHDASLCRSFDAGDDVEQRRFPRSIGPDQCNDLTETDVETHVLDCAQAAKIFRDILDLQADACTPHPGLGDLQFGGGRRDGFGRGFAHKTVGRALPCRAQCAGDPGRRVKNDTEEGDPVDQ